MSTPQAGFGNCGCKPDTAPCEQKACINKNTISIDVDIWDDPGCEGDNVVRLYNTGECVFHDGYFYFSLEDMNVDKPPTAKWSEPYTKCEMLKPSTPHPDFVDTDTTFVITANAAGDIVLTGSDGSVSTVQLASTSDTFGTAKTAAAAGIDSLGQSYIVGDGLVTFPDGTTISRILPPKGYAALTKDTTVPIGLGAGGMKLLNGMTSGGTDFIVPRDGVYAINVSWIFQNLGSNASDATLEILVNGVKTKAMTVHPAEVGVNDHIETTLGKWVDLVNGDKISFQLVDFADTRLSTGIAEVEWKGNV